MSTALEIAKQYTEQTHNLLIPIKTVAEIAEIQKPVMNVVYISTNLDDKEIYIQEKESKGYRDKDEKWVNQYVAPKYALTKKGLNKLARAAGIKILNTSPVIPSTCQKCIAVNGKIGTAVKCGECKNQDVKFQVKISVPQLTGENIEYVAHKEICIMTETIDMTEKQKSQYIKFRNEICESKALNRAFRAALLLKPTYSIEELKKPFVVAFLVPNLNDPDVKAAVLKKYSQSMNNLFGSIDPQPKVITITDENESQSEPPDICDDKEDLQPEPIQGTTEKNEYNPRVCRNCGDSLSDNVSTYSREHYGAPLCMKCQKTEKKIK